MKNHRTKYFLILNAFIAFAAFLLRIAVSGQLIANDSFVTAPPYVTDMATYNYLSEGILFGIFPETFYYQPFYYSVFLPVVKFILRVDFWSVAFAQSLCGAAIVYLAGLSAAFIFGRRSGIAAAILAAFSTMLVFYVPYQLLEIQECLWFTLLFYLILRAFKTDRIRYWIWAGVILSFAVLSRGNAWCFLPVAALAAFYAGKSWKKAAMRFAILFACSILPILPFSIYNSVKTSSFAGPSTAGSAVLAIGNNPEAAPGGLLVPQPETYEAWFAAERAGGRSVVSRIADWAVHEPLEFLELQFRKFMLFFDSKEIPNNISITENGEKSSLLVFAFVPTGAIIMLALISFILLARRIFRKRAFTLLVLSIFLYVCAASVFYILARFRVPVIGLLCIIAAYAPVAIWRDFKKRNLKKILIYDGGAIVFATFIVFFVNDIYQFKIEPSLMRIIRPHGVHLNSNGKYIIRDNSSFFNGNRDFIAAAKGISITKYFVVPEDAKKMSHAKLFLTLVSEKNESLLTKVNGLTAIINLNAGKLSEPSISIPASPNGKYEIEFIDSPSDNVFIIYDQTRNYRRTRVNGEIINGEAVMKIELED